MVSITIDGVKVDVPDNSTVLDAEMCIRDSVCPYHAKKAVTDPLSSISDFKYKIALPAPALYAQFKMLGHEDKVDRVLSGLKAMGFDDVFEVAKGAEICSKAIAEELKKSHIKPLISSACPAVVRLIQVRFPELLDNVVKVDAPVEVAAKVAKMEFAKKNNVDISEIGAYFITPCPAKMTSIKAPLAKEKSDVDGAISILEVYGLLTGQLKAAEAKRFSGVKASAKGIGWANSGGEIYAIGEKNALAVDGIGNVARALEDIENDKLKDCLLYTSYFCNLEVFSNIYRFVVRHMERSGQSVFLMLCTITELDGAPPESGDRTQKIIEHFHDSVKASLRRGDAYTRSVSYTHLKEFVGDGSNYHDLYIY